MAFFIHCPLWNYFIQIKRFSIGLQLLSPILPVCFVIDWICKSMHHDCQYPRICFLSGGTSSVRFYTQALPVRDTSCENGNTRLWVCVARFYSSVGTFHVVVYRRLTHGMFSFGAGVPIFRYINRLLFFKIQTGKCVRCNSFDTFPRVCLKPDLREVYIAHTMCGSAFT